MAWYAESAKGVNKDKDSIALNIWSMRKSPFLILDRRKIDQHYDDFCSSKLSSIHEGHSVCF